MVNSGVVNTSDGRQQVKEGGRGGPLMDGYYMYDKHSAEDGQRGEKNI